MDTRLCKSGLELQEKREKHSDSSKHPTPISYALRTSSLSAQPHMQPNAHGRGAVLCLSPHSSILPPLPSLTCACLIWPCLCQVPCNLPITASGRLFWQHASAGGTPLPGSPPQPQGLRTGSKGISLTFETPVSQLSCPLPCAIFHTSAPPARLS